jgi:uncharacterized protein involved in exopolysaccharide biosynthesis
VADPTRLTGAKPSDTSVAPRRSFQDDGEADVGMFELVNMILTRWRFVLGLPLVVGILAAAITLSIPPTYRAITALVAETKPQSRLPAGISSIAGQLGFQLGTDATQSPRFYADVLKSRALLERVAQTQFRDPRSNNPADSTTLLVLLKVAQGDRSDSLYRTARKLYDLVHVQVDNQTGILRLSVDLRYPRLAADVANTFVHYLNEFNARVRRTQAGERRKFSEARMGEALEALNQSQDRLRDFHDRNRRWSESPSLQSEEGTLRRQLSIQQEVYLTLRREFESARIDEVNETPVVTVIDSAAVPRQKAKPQRLVIVLIAVSVAAVIAVVLALGAGYAQRVSGNTEEYRQFRGLLAGARGDVRRLLRLPPVRRD